MRRFTLLLFLSLFVAGLSGCGSDNDFDYMTNSGGGANPNTQTGGLVFNFVRAQTVVPEGTADLRFEFLDSSGNVVRTEERPFAAQITFDDVSTTVVRVRVSSLDEDGVVVARTEETVTVTAGETQEVVFDVVTSFDRLIIQGGPVVETVQGTAQLSALAGFSDNSTAPLDIGLVDLESDNTSVATVDANGLVTAVAPGMTTISASYTIAGTSETFAADPVSVTVTAAVLESLAITPNPVNVKAGGTVGLSIQGTLSDNSNVNINAGAPSYSVDNTSVATISNDGTVTGVAEGTTTFTVTHTIGEQVTSSPVTINVGPPSLDTITVTPDPVMITTAGTAQFAIEGQFSDGSTDTINPTGATFTGHDTDVVTIDPNGLVTPVAAGETSVNIATIDPVSNGTISYDPVTITVMEDVTLDSLTVTPDPVNLMAGNTVQLDIEANFSDSTSQTVDPNEPTYSVTDDSVASINSSGLITGLQEGTTDFTVTYDLAGGGQVTAGPISIAVTPPTLQSLTVAPDPICLSGGTLQLSVTGNYSDNSSLPLDASAATYSGHNTGVVTIDANGLITPVAVGETTVTVSYLDPDTNTTLMSDPVTIKVVGPPIVLSGANVFDTDTGQLNGSTPSGWTGVSLDIESFELQGGATLTVTGSLPFWINACEDVTVAGIIDVNGQDGGDANGSTPGIAGLGGPGGFAGGLGGGTDNSNRNGADGDGDGGGGGGVTLGFQFTGPGSGFGENENAGGGGGHATTGQTGGAGGGTGTPGAGGASYASLPALLLGGSGGGGGSAFIDAVGNAHAGGGGGGGGGVVNIIADGIITVSGAIEAAGGDGGGKDPNVNAGSGGGAGAGGSIQLLSPTAPNVTGTLDVSGGAGGVGVGNGGNGSVGRTNVGTI